MDVLKNIYVEYEVLPGWMKSTKNCREFKDLPQEAQTFVETVEVLIGIPIRWIGVGADRADIIIRDV